MWQRPEAAAVAADGGGGIRSGWQQWRAVVGVAGGGVNGSGRRWRRERLTDPALYGGGGSDRWHQRAEAEAVAAALAAAVAANGGGSGSGQRQMQQRRRTATMAVSVNGGGRGRRHQGLRGWCLGGSDFAIRSEPSQAKAKGRKWKHLSGVEWRYYRVSCFPVFFVRVFPALPYFLIPDSTLFSITPFHRPQFHHCWFLVVWLSSVRGK